MSGFSTNGVPNVSVFTGNEQFAVDTEASSGQVPQSASVTLAQLANEILYLSNRTDGSTVAGTRYIVDIDLQTPQVITGISVLVGGTGGTDKWIAELHDSTGALVATSALAGVTTATAGTFQNLPFVSAFTVTRANAGQYYVALQSNGTTAKYAAVNSPTSPHVSGSAAGSFGTSASITPPTTYTAGQAPVVLAY